MKQYDFENKINRTGASAIKESEYIVRLALGLNYYPDTISMWVADMDFAVAPEIVEAMKRRADLATFGYSAFSDDYYASVKSWFKRRHSMTINSSDIVYSPGTVNATTNIVRALTKEGDGVIIQTPVYYPFKRVIAENGRCVVENTLLVDAENHYTIDFEDFEAKCADPQTKLFILCNPHNPIGQIWGREVVQRLVDICKANDVILFSDEVHADIIRKEANFTSTLNLDNTDDVIVATAVNKSFNLAGLHITNLVIRNTELRDRLNAYTGLVAINPFAEAAAIAAYNECEEWLDLMNNILDENLKYLNSFLANRMSKVHCNIPEATYLAWLDFRKYGIKESELLHLFADQAHVIVEGGSMFGEEGRGFIRMNVACPKSLLVEALERMARVLPE